MSRILQLFCVQDCAQSRSLLNIERMPWFRFLFEIWVDVKHGVASAVLGMYNSRNPGVYRHLEDKTHQDLVGGFVIMLTGKILVSRPRF